MKKILILMAFLIAQQFASAQYLAAFNDNLHKFWVFEMGTFTQLEYLEIQNYQVGGILVAYLDNGSNLKVYGNGNSKTLMTGDPIKYEATDYLLGYSMYEQLNVFDKGETVVLSTQADAYIVRDSIIAWRNRINKNVEVYYEGNIYQLEDGLIYQPIESFKAGDNVIAYVQNSTEQFKIFYLGETIVLDDFVQEMVFDAGRDIVAYIDVPDMEFKAYFRGEEFILESFRPNSFKVGDEMVAYVDNMGRLKLFDKGKIIEISNFEPEFYEVTDRVLVYEEQGFFKTYCNGEIYVVERYIPQPYRVDYNSIAYLDENRFVKVFQNCEPKTINYEKVSEINLIRDLVIYVKGINKSVIYFNGQTYEH